MSTPKGSLVAPPRVVAVAPSSPAALAGIRPGDLLVRIDGHEPRDVIAYQQLVDGADPRIELERDDEALVVVVAKGEGEALGVEVESPLFDRVQTCDNHCPFCFIYQLPKGMRRSLYLKDDDYRLSFLYGNFTTLTRFTELDLERVVSEGLGPLYVSVHATDPEVRSTLLRNRRGGTSLRWLRALLDHGIEVHGQIVVCPGINDGEVLADTLRTLALDFTELASVAVVPLGISDHSDEPTMREHTGIEAAAVVDLVEAWQARFQSLLGRPVVHAADEYYLLADRPFPPAEHYDGFDMYEDGIGMARAFIEEFEGRSDEPVGPTAGFFASVDGAPAVGYRAERTGTPVRLGPRRPAADAPVGILTGTLGAPVLRPLVAGLDRDDVRVIPVANRTFGGNIGVTGLLCGADVARVLEGQPDGHRYLLPDVCLSNGVFLDDWTLHRLPRRVEVIATNGRALRDALRPSSESTA